MKFNEYLKENKIIVVSFTKKDDPKFAKVLKKNKATVTDWYDRDYGLKLDISIPSNKIKSFALDIEKMKDYKIEE